MLGFLTTHTDMLKEVEESCKVVKTMRENFDNMAGALDELTRLQDDMKKSASKLDSLNPKSDENRKKLEKLAQDARTSLDKYKKILNETAKKLAPYPDFTSAANEIYDAWDELQEDLSETNDNFIELKFSEYDGKDKVEDYEAIVAKDPSNKTWNSVTVESTADSLLEIKACTKSNSSLMSQDTIYQLYIKDVTKGGTSDWNILSNVDGCFDADGYSVELVAINGLHLKELNRDEIKPVVKREIATGKVILDIVRTVICRPQTDAVETGYPAQGESSVAAISKPATTENNIRTISDNNGSHFGWTDVLLILVVAFVTVIISILIA